MQHDNNIFQLLRIGTYIYIHALNDEFAQIFVYTYVGIYVYSKTVPI